MFAMVLTIGGAEGDGTTGIADGGIVFPEPWGAEDNMMSSGGNVEADFFFIASDSKDKGTVLGEVATLGGMTICKNKGDWGGLGKTRELRIAFN